MAAVEKHPGAERPPDRPLLLFDGDCGFCRFWVARWRATTRDQVDFAPAQQESCSAFHRSPSKLGRDRCNSSSRRETVYGGAEAVFRTLAYHQGAAGCWPSTVACRGARPVSEAAYRLVAERHEDSSLSSPGWPWGRDPEPSSYVLSRWVFLRLLGLVYVIAFLSLWGQLVGLIGAHGILPVGQFSASSAAQFRLRRLPSLSRR